jgi:hypothetical protein
MAGRRFGISIAGACLLAACTGANADRMPSAAVETAPSNSIVTRHSEADSRFIEPAPAEPAPPIVQLVGMSAGDVTRLLGLPKMLRREPPAQVWQYASSRCVMFVFLYEGQPASGMTKSASTDRDWRVHYIEALSRVDGKPMPMPDCLNGLIDRRPLALGEG